MVFICRKKKCLCLFSGKAAVVRSILQKKFCYPVQEPRGVLNPWPNPCILWMNPLSTYFLDRKNLKKSDQKKRKKEPHEIEKKKHPVLLKLPLFLSVVTPNQDYIHSFWKLLTFGKKKKEKYFFILFVLIWQNFLRNPKPSKFHFYKYGLDGYIGLQTAPTTPKQF